ncbi:MAG: right-handed parallel beta-helix repeat-containing protein, partial [Phycisphaerales bacterium]|nr:right-handed parallel beta-helix repeat-containing protein [Phycisphaerales bacterium]
MNRIAAVVAGLSLAFVGTSATIAGTINVPGDQPTIAAAISASVNGDVINIAAGTYNEANLNPDGKAITIGSASGNLDVTIDAQQGGRVFVIQSGEGDGTVIQDLVITGGFASGSWPSSSGGGIYCEASNPTINGCTISGNEAGYGGGIFCWRSDPTISGCTIEGNEAGQGGGIDCNDSNPAITDCEISSNTATNGYGGGIYFHNNSSPTITGCTITGNSVYGYGGGIYCENGNPTFISGSVCGNSPNQISGGNITSSACWIAPSCDGNPYIIIANQQEQIDQLLTMHDQQQSAIT